MAQFTVGATATNTSSLALGLGASDTGNNAVAVGPNATAALDGTALGAGASVTHAGAIALGRSAASTTTGQLVVGSSLTAISEALFGQGDNIATPAATVTIRTTDTASTETDTVASSLLLRSGRGTGAAAGTTITLQTPDATTTGTTLQTLVQRASFGTAIAIGDGSHTGTVSIGSASAGSVAIAGNTITVTAAANTNITLQTSGTGDVLIPGTGGDSVKIGLDAVASSTRAVAIGQGSNASGFAVSLGGFSQANQQDTALGYLAVATGTNSLAVGYDADATTSQATAVGPAAQATTNAGTIAVGAQANASGSSAVVVGRVSTASHAGAIVLGSYAASTVAQQCVIGGSGTLNSQITSMLVGQGDNTAAPPSTLTFRTTNTATSQTDQVATSIVMQSGRGTGAAVGTTISLQTPDSTTTGTTLQTLVERALFGSTIAIGANASAETLNIGTGAAAKTITIGSTNTTSSLAIQAGTGALSITQAGGDAITVGQVGGAGTGSTLGVPSFTTAERDANLTAVTGMVIYNSTTATFEGYDGSTWSDLAHGAASLSETLAVGNTIGANAIIFDNANSIIQSIDVTDGSTIQNITIRGGNRTGAGSSGSAGNVSISGGELQTVGTIGNGGSLTLTAGKGCAGFGSFVPSSSIIIGAGTSSQVAGDLTLKAGGGNVPGGTFVLSGAGGDVIVEGGKGGSVAGDRGGNISLSAGPGTFGPGGSVVIAAGNASATVTGATSAGGSVTVTTGNGAVRNGSAGASGSGGALSATLGDGAGIASAGHNAGAGGSALIVAGDGGSAFSTWGDAGGGGSFTFTAGNGGIGDSGQLAGNGGSFTITAGNGGNNGGGTPGVGGVLTLTAGQGGDTGAGGGISITSGAGGSTSGNSGAIAIDTGAVTSGTTGSITIGGTNASAVQVGHSAIATSVPGWIRVGAATDAVAVGDIAAHTSTSGGLFYDASAVRLTLGAAGTGSISVPGSGTNSQQFGPGAATTGIESVAVGASATTGNSYCTVIGYGANASSTYNVAIGRNASITGFGSVAVGANANVTNSQAVAIGNSVVLSSTSSVAIGQSVSVTGNESVAIGRLANSTGAFNTLVGYNTNSTSGGNNTLIGWNANSTSSVAVAIGIAATTSGTESTAVGANTQALGTKVLAIGRYTIGVADYSTAVGVEAVAGTGSVCVGAPSVEEDKPPSAGLGTANTAIGGSARVLQISTITVLDYTLISAGVDTISGTRPRPPGASGSFTGTEGAQWTAATSNDVTANNIYTWIRFNVDYLWATVNANVVTVIGDLSALSTTASGAAMTVSLGTPPNNTVALGSFTEVANTGSVVIGRGAVDTAANQFVLGSTSAPITALHLGRGVTGIAPDASVSLRTTDTTTTETDVAGSSLVIQSGRGTGAATATSISFQTPTATTSGTTQQTLATRLTINSAAVTADTAIRIGTATDAAAQGDLVAGLTGAARMFYDQSLARMTLYNGAGTSVIVLDASNATTYTTNLTATGWARLGTATDASGAGDLAAGLTGAARMFYDQSAGSLTLFETNQASSGVQFASTLLSDLSISATATGLIPNGALVLGVVVRVTTLITGPTSFDVGDGTDVDRWGATIALTAGTTTSPSGFTDNTIQWQTGGAGNVVLSPNGGAFTAGAARVVVAYVSLTAPTS